VAIEQITDLLIVNSCKLTHYQIVALRLVSRKTPESLEAAPMR